VHPQQSAQLSRCQTTIGRIKLEFHFSTANSSGAVANSASVLDAASNAGAAALPTHRFEEVGLLGPDRAFRGLHLEGQEQTELSPDIVGSDDVRDQTENVREPGRQAGFLGLGLRIRMLPAYFSPSWTAFQADRGRDFSVIVDGVSN
jgi:hypothetical protein